MQWPQKWLHRGFLVLAVMAFALALGVPAMASTMVNAAKQADHPPALTFQGQDTITNSYETTKPAAPDVGAFALDYGNIIGTTELGSITALPSLETPFLTAIATKPGYIGNVPALMHRKEPQTARAFTDINHRAINDQHRQVLKEPINVIGNTTDITIGQRASINSARSVPLIANLTYDGTSAAATPTIFR